MTTSLRRGLGMALLAFIVGCIGVAVRPTKTLAYSPPPATILCLFDDICSGGVAPTLTIDLAQLLVPDRFYFGGNTYTVTEGTSIVHGQPTPNGTLVFTRTDGTHSYALSGAKQHPSGDSRGDYWRIIVKGFSKNQGIARIDTANRLAAFQRWLTGRPLFTSLVSPALAQTPPTATPFGFKLTLKTPLTNANINSLMAYLRPPINGATDSHAFLGDSGCQISATGSLCLQTKVKFIAPEYPAGVTKVLTERIGQGGIEVQGNVAAPGSLTGFSIAPSALAVGGSVSISGGSSLPNYLTTNPPIKWEQVNPQLNSFYDQRTKGVTVPDLTVGRAGTTPAYPGADNSCPGAGGIYQWNLNSSSNRPCDTANSFSTPPEGKLWNIVRDGANGSTGSFELGNGATTLNFSGSGTLVFEGDVIIKSPITCSPGTRLGILTKGRISFQTNLVACGAFVTLDNSIYFDGDNGYQPTNGTMTGIFVAKNEVRLPKVGSLTDTYHINYDADFGRNPTVLFKSIMPLVLNTSS